jgi:hypothetical protein
MSLDCCSKAVPPCLWYGYVLLVVVRPCGPSGAATSLGTRVVQQGAPRQHHWSNIAHSSSTPDPGPREQVVSLRVQATAIRIPAPPLRRSRGDPAPAPAPAPPAVGSGIIAQLRAQAATNAAFLRLLTAKLDVDSAALAPLNGQGDDGACPGGRPRQDSVQPAPIPPVVSAAVGALQAQADGMRPGGNAVPRHPPQPPAHNPQPLPAPQKPPQPFPAPQPPPAIPQHLP